MKSPECPVIETERLVLDPLSQEDAKDLFSYRSDPEVARYQGWQPSNFEEAADFISEQSNIKFGQADQWCQLAIRSKHTRELIGDFGVHFPSTKEDPIEFGLSLKPAEQRKGYAREVMVAGIDLAFREWGYRRLIASVDPRNTASMALCRALGLRQEAHHVESYYFHGEWADDVIFAMLAREWLMDRVYDGTQ
ncbi:GNAT family protein [Burkholderia sp. Ac-20353]|uniref:GNAT family N-acetyltransferase n=1 Tax=Burkholderia sp. Ac-20353 TaxID=2703894 RepID=UPI003216208F